MKYEVSTWTHGQVCIKSARGLIALMEAGNDETRKSDAAFIVRAVNAYEPMREALEMMLRAFNVKEIDPLVAFATIEKAKAALEHCTEPVS